VSAAGLLALTARRDTVRVQDGARTLELRTQRQTRALAHAPVRLDQARRLVHPDDLAAERAPHKIHVRRDCIDGALLTTGVDTGGDR
jgi:hypothetical protein